MRSGLLLSFAGILLLAPVAVASAQSDDIRALTTTPIAPRGGVMMIPLTRGESDAPWPEQLTIRLADGRTIEAKIGWIHAHAAGEQHPTWTADPRRLAIRTPQPDDTLGVTGNPVLLARLPEDGSGAITFGRRRIDPIWFDRPTRHMRGEVPSLLLRVPAHDRPDVASPFEHWRWVLLAQSLHMEAPRPPALQEGDGVLNMLAEHYADVWQIGLARLEAESPGLAQHARELLTRICTDGDVSFAAWVADPSQTNSLLSHLLNTRRTGAALRNDVLAWIDEHDRVGFWIESDTGDAVRLAMVNPTARPAVVRFDWLGVNEPPLAVEVRPGELARTTIERPARDTFVRRPLERLMRGEEFASPDVLKVSSGGREVTIPLGPRAIAVTPPGYWLPPTRPPLTLAEVQGVAPLIDVQRSTIAQVRRLSGRWEVFFESRRPGDTNRDLPAAAADDARFTSIDEARGREAVILTIGDAADPQRNVLIIPERGWHHLARGDNDGTLQIHRRSYDDHWLCRVVLPDAWLRTLPGEHTFVSMMRTRRGMPAIDGSPRSTVPWSNHTGPVALDLAEWQDHP